MSPIATLAASAAASPGALASGLAASDSVLTQVVTILNIGFVGLAFLLMYLAYRLIAANPGVPVPNIRIYIGAAIFLAVLSCGSELAKLWIARQPVRLWVYVSPSLFPQEVGPVKLAAQSQQWELKSPSLSLTVVNDETLTLQLDTLTQKIDQLQAVVNAYTTQQAKSEQDVGIGADH